MLILPLANSSVAEAGAGSGTNQKMFERGDCNHDGGINIADAIYMLQNLFPQEFPLNTLNCFDACDANDDSQFNIGDPIRLLGSFHFSGGSYPLPLPYGSCGVDTTGIPDCDNFDHCP